MESGMDMSHIQIDKLEKMLLCDDTVRETQMQEFLTASDLVSNAAQEEEVTGKPTGTSTTSSVHNVIIFSAGETNSFMGNRSGLT